MKRIGIIISLIAFAVICHAQNSTGNGSFMKLFKEIALYDSRCTQEKVYLHLDNNSYFIDETIYFKAYVVRASSLKYTDLSKVLYLGRRLLFLARDTRLPVKQHNRKLCQPVHLFPKRRRPTAHAS